MKTTEIVQMTNFHKSSSGKTIMTTEPKFVPNEAVSIKTEEGIELNVRLIDCVGYIGGRRYRTHGRRRRAGL